MTFPAFFRAISGPAALGLCLLLASCGSSPRVKGVPRKLPKIDLYGSSSTPSHGMEKHDYPFDTNGEYMTSWVAQGGGSEAGTADYERWRGSHGGSVSRRQPSPVRKTSSTKKSSSSKSKSSSGGGSYTIKKGDTLGAIAARHKTTVSKLKAANGLSSDFIREGKTLRIPK